MCSLLTHHQIFFNTKNLNIFLNFKNIYNYENFVAEKILLNNNRIDLDIDTTNNILNYFGELKYKLDIQDLNLNFKKKENSILEIKKLISLTMDTKKIELQEEYLIKNLKLI